MTLLPQRHEDTKLNFLVFVPSCLPAEAPRAGRSLWRKGGTQNVLYSPSCHLFLMGYRNGAIVRIACGVCLAVLPLTFIPARAQQSPSGFYVIINSKKNCPNKVSSHVGSKMYCVPKEPVITEADFESVSNVKYDSFLQKYILLKLTVSGFKSLKFITQRLPESKLALVIDNQVAGVFDNVDKNVSRTIPISGGGIHAPEVQWIYDRLKKKSP